MPGRLLILDFFSQEPDCREKKQRFLGVKTYSVKWYQKALDVLYTWIYSIHCRLLKEQFIAKARRGEKEGKDGTQ